MKTKRSRKRPVTIRSLIGKVKLPIDKRYHRLTLAFNDRGKMPLEQRLVEQLFRFHRPGEEIEDTLGRIISDRETALAILAEDRLWEYRSKI